jgi:hypothetical protein
MPALSRSSFWRGTRLACAALALGLAVPLHASVTIPATLDELAAEADLVVLARVAHVATRQAAGTQRVERVVTLDVVRALKGSPGEALAIVLPGGTFGRYRTIAPGVPEVFDGEEAVLFLRASGVAGPQLVGLSQGLLRVRVDPVTGERMVGATTAAGTDGPIVRGAADRGPQPLSSVEARIARVVLAQLRVRR